MKSTSMKNVATCMVAMVTFAACNNADKANNKTENGHAGWTQAQRVEYMQGCVSSAKAAYEKMGKQPDSSLIIKYCKCAGISLEQKYTYDEAVKVPPQEMKAFVIEAAKKCK